ncbi:MAG: hypothetical protein P1P89_19750 [Desulfobacterales bacterium]|nr:hypothetical protein [Desulfobacterales bacterium]
MNEVLRQTALFIRDLLGYSEQLIRIGRMDFDIQDFTMEYIGVDSLGQSQRLSSGEGYDGATEIMTYAQNWRAPITVSFYGDNAWYMANKFALLIKSQKSFELQQAQGIGILQASGITDVKILAGQQYGERQEITLNVLYNVSEDVATKRIDTAQLEVWTENNPIIEETT